MAQMIEVFSQIFRLFSLSLLFPEFLRQNIFVILNIILFVPWISEIKCFHYSLHSVYCFYVSFLNFWDKIFPLFHILFRLQLFSKYIFFKFAFKFVCHIVIITSLISSKLGLDVRWKSYNIFKVHYNVC